MRHTRVHILGASGSGTSTLGAVLARNVSCQHFDVDAFFWLPTQPPFQTIRPRPDRQALLAEALASCPSWTLSGSLCGWGDPFIPLFDLVVFIGLPADSPDPAARPRGKPLRRRHLAGRPHAQATSAVYGMGDGIR